MLAEYWHDAKEIKQVCLSQKFKAGFMSVSFEISFDFAQFQPQARDGGGGGGGLR